MDLPWFLSSFLPYAFRLSLGVPGGLSSVTLCPTLLRHSLATLVHAVRIGGRMTTEHGELRKEGPYRCNLPARATRLPFPFPSIPPLVTPSGPGSAGREEWNGQRNGKGMEVINRRAAREEDGESTGCTLLPAASPSSAHCHSPRYTPILSPVRRRPEGPRAAPGPDGRGEDGERSE